MLPRKLPSRAAGQLPPRAPLRPVLGKDNRVLCLPLQVALGLFHLKPSEKGLREPPEQRGLVPTGAWLPIHACVLVHVATEGSPWQKASPFSGTCQETRPGQQLHTLNGPHCAGAGPGKSGRNHLQSTHIERAPRRLRRSQGRAGAGVGSQAARGQCRVGIPAAVLPRGLHCALRRPSHMSPGLSEEGCPCPGIPSALQLGKSEERGAGWEGVVSPARQPEHRGGACLFNFILLCSEHLP